MFHLMTHAFFKALLFLAAGIVIHQLAGEQDIRKMGGLRGSCRSRGSMFLIGTLALDGHPAALGLLVEGRDPRLGARTRWRARLVPLRRRPARRTAHGHVCASGSTSSSSTASRPRSCSSTPASHGDGDDTGEDADGHDAHGHGEGPRSMLIPVGVLTVLAAIGGFVEIPGVWHAVRELDRPASPSRSSTRACCRTTARALIAVTRGRPRRRRRVARVQGRPRDRRQAAPCVSVLEHKFYFDELYDALFSRPAQVIAARLRDDVEAPVVQGSLGEIAAGVREVAGGTARLQSGLLRSYALVIAASVAVLVVVFLAVR